AGVDSTSPGVATSPVGQPVSKLYFRFLVNVGNISQPAWEYVPGYADIDSCKMVGPHQGAIKLSDVSSGDAFVGSANPISIAAWQFLRLNLPQDAYPGSKVTGSALSIIEFLFGIIPSVTSTVFGFDQTAIFQNKGKYIVPSYSYIRLDNPSYKKLGGGTRVKEIDISDNWSTMATGQSSFQYGQTFDYTSTLPNGQIVSVGVATYEPVAGGDENSLKQPLPYDEKYLLAPNNAMYTETPLGESLYPSPGVVYSKVTVANLLYPGVKRTATGKTVNEFYTAYDFPVIAKNTGITVDRVKPNILMDIFSIGVKDFTTASEGFSVEVNDMAGKEKSQEVYDKNGALISSVKYDYKLDNLGNLNNNVQVINPDGTVGVASIGKDIDMWEDMREEDSQTMGMGVDVNFDTFVLPFLVLAIPDVFPDYSSEHTRFHSAVTTKYIYRSGLVDKITKVQNGSSATTQNLMYDSETGEVLLTKTNNEFEKPVYNFTYPAHWAYDGMGSAYRNIGAYVSGFNTTSTGVISVPSGYPSTYFAPGDEVEEYAVTAAGPLYSITLSNVKGWVTQPSGGSSYVLMDANGNPIPSLSKALVKVIRSGRRNMPSVPVASIASLVSPVNSLGDSIKINKSTQILQASGSLFNNFWKIPNDAVMKQKCNSLATPTAACIAQFMDSVIVNHKLFAKPSDSIKFGKYVSSCSTFSNYLYFALSEEKGLDIATSFQFQLGSCVGTISANPSGGGAVPGPIYPVSLYQLTPYISGTYYTNPSGCINLYGPSGFSEPVSLAEICMSCTNCYDTCENIAVKSSFNPYAVGMLGNWRPERNYVYYDSRSPTLASTTSNIYNTGIFNRFTQIWDVPTGGATIWPLDTADKDWTWTSRISMYDQKGNEIEDVDALGRYSSALYGYIKSLPVAVSSNAKFKEIAFDGFEDYGFTNSCSSPCDTRHFSYLNYIT
ncbi:MAG TPA: hypothetical protein VK890_05090, partial [Bacteroidia bacterium]|nr:hypothetical protein [Bacteroidia bacterium]